MPLPVVVTNLPNSTDDIIEGTGSLREFYRQLKKSGITIPSGPAEPPGTTINDMLKGMDKITTGSITTGSINTTATALAKGAPVPAGSQADDTLSPLVRSAIDGIATGGSRAADSIIAAGNTLPSKGGEMASGFTSGINASGIGATIGRAAAAAISNAAANIHVQMSAPTAKADTGPVGGSVASVAV